MKGQIFFSIVLAACACSVRAAEQPWSLLVQSGAEAFLAGRYVEATAAYEAAARQAESFSTADPRRAVSFANLAAGRHVLGRDEEARLLFLKALEAWESAGKARSLEAAAVWSNLAAVERQLGRFEDAERALAQSIAIVEEKLGPEHPSLASRWALAAMLKKDQGRPAEAEALLRRALDMQKRMLPEDHVETSTTWSALGEVYRLQGRMREAKSAFECALKMRERVLGSSHPQVAVVWTDLGLLAEQRHKQGAAEAAFRKALDIDHGTFGSSHSRVLRDRYLLARVLLARRKYSEAESLLLGTQEVAPRDAGVLAGLAALYHETGEYQRADEYYRRLEKALAAKPPSTERWAEILENHALVLRKLEEYAEAARMETDAMGVRVRRSLSRSESR